MRVKCKVSIPSRGASKREIIHIPDIELEGLTEEEVIDVVNGYFEDWLAENIDAEWELED